MFGLGFTLVVFWIIETPDKFINSKKAKKKYGTLIEDLKIKKSFILIAYYPLYLIRRLAFLLILILQLEMPIAQLIEIILLTNIPVLFTLTFRSSFISSFLDHSKEH